MLSNNVLVEPSDGICLKETSCFVYGITHGAKGDKSRWQVLLSTDANLEGRGFLDVLPAEIRESICGRYNRENIIQ